MIAPLVLLLALAPGRDYEVPARRLSWEDLGPETFPLAWRLPETHRSPDRDLVAEMERLVALRFEPVELAGRRVGSFGDLVAASRPLDDTARERMLSELAERSPNVAADWGRGLSQLLLDGKLRSDRWDPDVDHGRDGILTAEPWDLADEGEPWSSLEVTPLAEQAATLFFADPRALKAAENDYRAYPDDVGAAYEEIYPLEDGHARGRDPDGAAFAFTRIRFTCDLPFPFGGYACDLRVLHTAEPGERLVTHVFSPSDDFYWLAGRDVALPVTTSGGERVALLVVRQYGFDLEGVPDGSSDRRAALRSSLGNLRLRAEARQAAAGRAPGSGDLVVPEFELRGRRP